MFLNTNPISVSATGLLPSAALAGIALFANEKKFAEGPASTLTAAWSNVTAGVHRLVAVGTDAGGLTYTSAPVFIAVADPLVRSNSVWSNLDNGTDQSTNWFAPDFDASSWTNGPAELGYGDGDEATLVGFGPDSLNKHITTYIRHAFVATNVASLTNLILTLKYDDAGVVYLNGIEIYRTANLPAAPALITYTNLARVPRWTMQSSPSAGARPIWWREPTCWRSRFTSNR